MSHHGGDPNMGDLPHRVPNDPRFFTADVHITPDGRARIGGHDYTPAEYADMLRRAGYDGSKPVRLIGCDAGSNDFAKQLSKHLDAPVVAPTKPAWTDSRGRVFTSDAELGPDGTRQPKIPPNGEWETHHPDGSKSKASEDGFAPGTDPKDKDGLDPTDAKDRPGRVDEDKVVEVEKPENNIPMKDRIQDPEYRAKYYDERSDGWHRKQIGVEDASGDPVPKIREKDGEFIETEKETATSGKYQPDPDNPKKDWASSRRAGEQEVDDFVDANRGHPDRDVEKVVADRQKAIEDLEQAKKDHDSSPTEKTAEDKRDAFERQTNEGERLGDLAGENAIPVEFGSPATRLDPNLGGSGRFDQIWEVPDGNGGTKYVLVEAKGPNGTLTPRRGLDGELYMQGHPEYAKSILREMATNRLTPELEAKMRSRGATDADIDAYKDALKQERDLARKITAGYPDNSEYVHVKAHVKEEPIPGGTDTRDVYDGYTMKKFQ
ncbi:hypothetical protein BBK82_41720 [Lentzea guizhouensis]|uniref:Uncharacterized protein n=1 Tax=Lentzea guizhouensis TaxID=1586287 RepID=A0A1B2HUU0_9PSEU|nr:hypothetical protein BBK82_41720 [Lentzea guizhouensis]